MPIRSLRHSLSHLWYHPRRVASLPWQSYRGVDSNPIGFLVVFLFLRRLIVLSVPRHLVVRLLADNQAVDTLLLAAFFYYWLFETPAWGLEPYRSQLFIFRPAGSKKRR